MEQNKPIAFRPHNSLRALIIEHAENENISLGAAVRDLVIVAFVHLGKWPVRPEPQR